MTLLLKLLKVLIAIKSIDQDYKGLPERLRIHTKEFQIGEKNILCFIYLGGLRSSGVYCEKAELSIEFLIYRGNTYD